MVKLLLIGLWVCAVSIGGVYLSASLSQAPAETQAPPAVVASIVRGNSISIPVINNGVVDGYFLGRISLSVDSEKAKKVQLPLEVMLTDQLFSLLMGNRMIDLKNVGSFEPDKFRSLIKDGINKKVGDDVVAEVLVEQLDYMSKDAIQNASKGGKGAPAMQKIVDGVTVEEPKSAGH